MGCSGSKVAPVSAANPTTSYEPNHAEGPAGPQGQGSSDVFVVDCGSRHTKIHCLVIGSDGSVTQRAEQPVRPAGGEVGNLPLHTQLENTTYAEEFLPVLKAELQVLGWVEAGGAIIFLGATGGVRKSMANGAIKDEQIVEFKAALAATLNSSQSSSGAVEFKVLDGNDEAKYELAATQFIFTPFFAREGKRQALFFSGGGQTCQFGFGEPAELCSLDAGISDAQDAMKRSKEAPVEELQEVVAKARSDLQQEVDASWPTLPLPDPLVGDFVGNQMHEDAAQLGFGKEFLSPPQVITRIDRICSELVNREGDGWAKAEAKWKEWASENRFIGLAAALRLRAILTHFDDGCSLYFAKTAPPSPGSSDVGLPVSWPVGYGAFIAKSRSG